MASCLSNQAFVFVKPHAATSDQVVKFVRDTLTEHGIEIRDQGCLTGVEIGHRNIVDRHYAAIADHGVLKDPAELTLSPETLARFHDAFGVPWDPNLVRNAKQFAAETGLSAREQNALWEQACYAKLAPGMYAARLEGDDIEPRIVVNGFYPRMREKLTEAGAKIIWFDTIFAPAMLSWRTFRAGIIGATNPATAKPDSIRGRLYRHPDSYGLTKAPTVQENGVHASAGPLEAARERLIWLGADAGAFPLLDALRENGLGEPRILALLENPQILQGEQHRPAFDVLEDVDAGDALEILLDNARQGII